MCLFVGCVCVCVSICGGLLYCGIPVETTLGVS
jgi:hypothetical protein